MITDGPFQVVLGSRVLGGRALSGGMPLYKYVSNRCLTAFQNLMCGAKLSEYHTGYRAFSREVLESLPLLENSDDFVFDNQILAQILLAGFEVGEVSCPAAYFEEASSINFRRSLRYGLGVRHHLAAGVPAAQAARQPAHLRSRRADGCSRCPPARPAPRSPEGLDPDAEGPPPHAPRGFGEPASGTPFPSSARNGTAFPFQAAIQALRRRNKSHSNQPLVI